MTVIRGTGWIPDPTPSEAERAAAMLRVARFGGSSLPSEGGVTRDPWILDQSASQACSGHWMVQTVYGSTGFQGSPYVPWWLAREADVPPNSEPMPNVGVSAFAMTRTVSEHGVPPWASWNPESPGFDYGASPPALARIAGQRHTFEVTPIWSGGSAAVDAVCGALAQGIPCGVVVNTDNRFRFPVNGLVLPEEDKGDGDHIVTAWRYRTRATGAREILIVNSWGPTYGFGGVTWMVEERIAGSPFLTIARRIAA